MSRKKIIITSLMILTALLVIVIYLNTHNKLGEAQKYLLGTVITIPDKDGFEAKMTNIKGENLRGDIKDLKTGKKSSGDVIAHVGQKMNLSDDGSSFLMPFEVDYGENKKYVYLGIFYLEPTNTSIIGKNNSTKIIKHPYSYLLGENIIIEKINNFISGSYSFSVNVEYVGNTGIKNHYVLRSYYENEDFEVAKNCEEIGTIIERKRGDGKSYNVCVFNDSHECTLEAYENGNCPVKGYDVSITDSMIEKWGIAQGFLFKNGGFIFPANYENCTIDDFYFGKCEMN